ncbi:MAG: hypothetical protein SGI73_17430 [Chloroflexota bacterium]|nr:hypothetical protein [Chloroflexota bacterium]
MAFLNRQERQTLLDELVQMNFNKAKGKLRRLDPKGRLAFYRNAQMSGRFHTRYELDGLGTRVTLVEQQIETAIKASKFTKSEFELIEVIVEPTPDNRM